MNGGPSHGDRSLGFLRLAILVMIFLARNLPASAQSIPLSAQLRPVNRQRPIRHLSPNMLARSHCLRLRNPSFRMRPFTPSLPARASDGSWSAASDRRIWRAGFFRPLREPGLIGRKSTDRIGEALPAALESVCRVRLQEMRSRPAPVLCCEKTHAIFVCPAGTSRLA